MDDTEVDFKELTGTGLDVEDVAGIVEVDEEEVPVVDEEIDTFGLNGRPKEEEGVEAVDDDYSEMEQLLMEANNWEER